MKLFPQDLRVVDHAHIVRKRAHSSSTGSSSGVGVAYDPNAPLPEPSLGKLGRLWAKGLGMSERQAAVGNAAAAEWTGAAGWLTAVLGPLLPGMVLLVAARKSGLDPGLAWASFGAVAASLSGLGFGPFAQAAFRTLHKPLQAAEIEGRMKEATDELDVAYLKLVRDAILTEAGEKAEQDIRAAIEALGQAIEKLPPVMIEPLDTTQLYSEARQLSAQALTEPDRVTADSITRRAQALERRAQAHEHSAVLAKRAAALRAEILAQIETLREGLAGHQLEEGVGPVAAFAELSETARRVAQEASSAAQARQELTQGL